MKECRKWNTLENIATTFKVFKEHNLFNVCKNFVRQLSFEFHKDNSISHT